MEPKFYYVCSIRQDKDTGDDIKVVHRFAESFDVATYYLKVVQDNMPDELFCLCAGVGGERINGI